MTRKFWRTALDWTGAAAFYLWNALMACAAVVLLPTVLELMGQTTRGRVPWDMAATGLLLVFIPPAFLVLGVWKWRRAPRALGSLFFGVEAPLFVLLLCRLFVLRQLTPAVAHVLVMLACGLVVFLGQLFKRPAPQTALGHAARVSASTMLAMAGLWLGGLFLFLWVPPAVELAGDIMRALADGTWWKHFWERPQAFPLAMLAVAVAFISAVVTCGLSFFLVAQYLRTWWRTVEDAQTHQPRPVMLLLSAAVLAFQVGVATRLGAQPEPATLSALLESPVMEPAVFEARRTELQHALLAAYLSPYRYTSDARTAESFVRNQRLRDAPEAWQDRGVAVFRVLAAPLLYDGNLNEDPQAAATAYQALFDAPIQKAERRSVLAALEATHDRNEREANLLSVDQHKVHLVAQDLRTSPQGPVATVTLEETYENQTPEQLEVLYLFSLPEAAVITGLWLGTDRDHMDRFVVATRGAAQRVYRAEVARRLDPALLEQVGPHQYRLRAFPIPAQEHELPTPQMHLRMTWVTPAQTDGWPLATVLEKRNVYWDESTARTCNGAPCVMPNDESWMPSHLGGPHDTPAPQAWWGPVEGPFISVDAARDTGPLPRQRVAVVVDTSFSMRPHQEALHQALRFAATLSAGHDVVIHVPENPVSHGRARALTAAQALEPDNLALMGSATADTLLQQHLLLAAGHTYDAVFVLTDEGAFDLTTARARSRLPRGVLSLVHLGGVPAPAHDDATLQSVQRSGGSAFSSLEEAWQAFGRQVLRGERSMDGWAFKPIAEPPPDAVRATGPLAMVLARQWVALQTQQGHTETVRQLQAVHEVASMVGMVTPYSSMLVLVTDTQRQALLSEEKKEDRFDREVEPGSESLRRPPNALASAAPEPGEWMLMLLTAGLLMVLLRR